MATVKRCDRCRNYYDKNDGVETIEGRPIIGIVVITNMTSRYKGYDLCDDCIKKLRKFLWMDVDKEE